MIMHDSTEWMHLIEIMPQWGDPNKVEPLSSNRLAIKLDQADHPKHGWPDHEPHHLAQVLVVSSSSALVQT
jgi:hypothetical protein